MINDYLGTNSNSNIPRGLEEGLVSQPLRYIFFSNLTFSMTDN